MGCPGSGAVTVLGVFQSCGAVTQRDAASGHGGGGLGILDAFSDLNDSVILRGWQMGSLLSNSFIGYERYQRSKRSCCKTCNDFY